MKGLRHSLLNEAARALEDSMGGESWLGRALLLGQRTIREFLEDNCPHMAAAIAYYALFSLFPLLLGLVALFGFALQSAALQDEVVRRVGSYLPGSADLVAENVRQVVRARGALGLLATLGFLWSAMAVFSALRRSLNAAWDLTGERPFWRQKLLELVMVVGVGLLLLLSLSLTAFFQLLDELLAPALGVGAAVHDFLWGLGGALLPLVFTALIFLLIYKFVPYTNVRWAEAGVGVLFAAPAFEIAKNLFVWYAQRFGQYELVYGSLGAVVGLLMWTYISALILLFGAELASEYAKLASQPMKGVGRHGRNTEARVSNDFRPADGGDML